MPFCSCPHCGRTNIRFEMHEAECAVQCAKCNGFFSPLCGKLGSSDFRDAPPIRRLPASADPEDMAGAISLNDSSEWLPTPERNRLSTGLMAAATIAVLFTGFGATLFLASRSGDSAKKQVTADETARGKPASADKGKPASADKGNGKYPYPECEACMAWLRNNVGSPDSIEPIDWYSRTAYEPRVRSAFTQEKGHYSITIPGGVRLGFKFRVKNVYGGMSICKYEFNVGTDGNINVCEDDYWRKPVQP